MKEIVVVTHNRDKFKEIKSLLQDIGLHIKQIPDSLQLPKEGKVSLEENAILKVEAGYKAFPTQIVIADDTGLEVDALNGAPGVLSARFAGEGVSYRDNRVKLLTELKNIKQREATFRCVVAIKGVESSVKLFEGKLRGYISEEEVGEFGFGYDSIFVVPSLNKTLAQLPLTIKNTLSHRAIAMKKLKIYLKKTLFGAWRSLDSAHGLGP